MNETKIQDRYKINPGTIERINLLKQFVGADKFEQILQGVALVDIPLEEDKYVELLKIPLDEPYVKQNGEGQRTTDNALKTIPYGDTEEILSFFCKPFAGRSLKQAKYTLDGISSLLQKLDPEVMKTVMGSMQSLKKKDTSSDASSSQTETSKKENESIN